MATRREPASSCAAVKGLRGEGKGKVADGGVIPLAEVREEVCKIQKSYERNIWKPRAKQHALRPRRGADLVVRHEFGLPVSSEAIHGPCWSPLTVGIT